MKTPENFHLTEDYACYRPLGQFSVQEIVSLVAAVIAYACDQKIQKLLVDTTQTTGVDSLSVIERYNLSEEFARNASAYIKVVLVAKPQLLHPRRFGVTVAKNRGLNLNVATSESEALAWLLNPQTD
jgi:hypothetical protein